MDEGGFILDYFTPAGSSLAESNRILLHIEKILRSTPEVENTSRRTGLQLGLAAVTEANNGDFTVKLKKDRERGIDEVIADVRSKITKSEPAADVEFVQLLQDMIGDLTSQPEPIVIKLFSQDGKLLNDTAPRVADAIGKVHGVVDVLNGVENVVSGPAVTFQVNPAVAARAGFTPEEIALDASAVLEGEPATTPVILNDRAYTIRVRFPDRNRSSLDSMTNTLLTSSTGHTATLGSLATITSRPWRNRDSTRKFAAPGGSNGAPGRCRPRHGHSRRTKSRQRFALAFFHPRRVWRTLRGKQTILPSSIYRLVARPRLPFCRAPFRVLYFLRAGRHPRLRRSLHLRWFSRPAYYQHQLQRRLSHGHDHGHRDCRQERHFVARCRASLPRSRILFGRSDDPSRPPPLASHRDDRHRHRRRHVAPGLRYRRRFRDAETAGHRRNRRFAKLDGFVAGVHSRHQLFPAPRPTLRNKTRRSQLEAAFDLSTKPCLNQFTLPGTPSKVNGGD